MISDAIRVNIKVTLYDSKDNKVAEIVEDKYITKEVLDNLKEIDGND